MPNDEMLTDDYVAGLLAKEANDSLKYSSMGMGAFSSDKKPANMPKPNTRFLRHIIRDTDTHNKNLLAKEAAESKARLKELESSEEKERRKRAGPQDIRKRQMGDIKAILGDKGNIGRSPRSEAKSHKRDASPSHRRHHKDRRSESPERSSGRRHHRSRRDESESDHEGRRRHRSDRRRSRSPDDKSRRHRHRSPLGSSDLMSKSHRSRGRDRDEDDQDLMSKSHRTRRDRSRERGQGLSIKGSSRRAAREQESSAAASDSDPLDEFIGPAPPPPVRSRGRGAASGASGMDRRFKADYDPKLDVEMGDGNNADNWDDAVEIFRDRKKWQQSQEQRMREAGYGEEVINKWKTGDQKDERDVQWAKAGEKREWDRGKEELSGLFSEFN